MQTTLLRRTIRHDFGPYALRARIRYNYSRHAPSVLAIHGARSGYSDLDSLTGGLQQRGISTLAINLSGHNATSPLPLETTSLANNIAEAAAFFDYLDDSKPATVIAHSLGGAVALALLKTHGKKIGRLVLFCPAVYASHAQDQPYGAPFRLAISRPYSYRDNDSIALLRQFNGELLLVGAQFDGLDPVAHGRQAGGSAGEIMAEGALRYSPIPKEVMQLLASALPVERSAVHTIAGCDHAVMRWLDADHMRAAPLLDTVSRFIGHGFAGTPVPAGMQ